MSADSFGPPRMSEQASDETRELLRALREDGPGPSGMKRMSKHLAAAGALSTLPSEAHARKRVDPRFATYARGVVALAVAGGLALSWQVMQQPSTNTGTAPLAAPEDQSGASETRSPAAVPEVRPAPDAETPTLSVDQLPSVQLPSVTAPTTTAPPPAMGTVRTAKAPATTEPAGPVAPSELELLQRAQAALAADPGRALAITSEQARVYPSGEFVQEREVIAVEALARLGKKDEALRRARALVERFPRTPYGDRLEVAVGRAL